MSRHTLYKPLFYSLQLLEKSFLPLPKKGKTHHYFFKGVQGLIGAGLFCLSAPLAGLKSFFPGVKVSQKTQEKEKGISFPDHFKVGVADSFFQSCGLGLPLTTKKEDEGAADWNHWIQGRFPDGKPHIEEDPDINQFFIDYLSHPEIIIEKLLAIGAMTYRFSLERAVLEPEEGKFDKTYIQKYRKFIEKLRENGIQPLVTLHHFVNPHWFLQKGGFEKEENIEGFVQYCEKMCDAFGDMVTHWVTINEVGIYPFQAYLRGVYPPGKKNLKLAAEVIKNLLICHCRTYERLKKKNPTLQIGVSHNWLRFTPFSTYNPFEKLICHYYSQITHYAVLRFFQTGVFTLQIPFLVNVSYDMLQAPQKLDFIGVQYYVEPLIKMSGFSIKSAAYKDEKMTGIGRFSPHGLKKALKEAATLKKTIWITETGSEMDMQGEYFKKVFSIMSDAIEEGIPLAGALIWTLRDNLEWDRGNTVRIGLYHANFEEKPAIQEFIKPLFHAHRDKVQLKVSETLQKK